MWGRDDARTCSRGYDQQSLSTPVSFNNVTYTVRQLCDNRSRCDVTADVTTFGDVRGGRPYPPLYLVVNYFCKSIFTDFVYRAVLYSLDDGGEHRLPLLRNCVSVG